MPLSAQWHSAKWHAEKVGRLALGKLAVGKLAVGKLAVGKLACSSGRGDHRPYFCIRDTPRPGAGPEWWRHITEQIVRKKKEKKSLNDSKEGNMGLYVHRNH